MVDINITFVNLNMKDDILRAIASIFEDTKESKYKIHICVADNTQNVDGIADALKEQFPTVDYIDCGGNVGFGAANNRSFRKTPARYYFALNRDTIIEKGRNTIDRLIEYMDTHPKTGAIGPKLVNLDGSLQYSCYRYNLGSLIIKPLKQLNWDEKYDWVKKRADQLLMKDFDHNKTIPVDWVLGAALVVRKEVADQIGFFDERYLAYLEDADWCHTMWEHNWPVYYVHDIIIQHAHARASAQVPGALKALWKNKAARIHLASWFKYLWKWRGKHGYDVRTSLHS